MQDRPSPEWTQPPPEPLPKPTAWPPTLALSITFILWGLISSLIITGVGMVVFAVAMTGWIGDIRHGRQH
jgi:hypothetical protein